MGGIKKQIIRIFFIFLIVTSGCISSNIINETNTYDEWSLLKSDSCVELCLQKTNQGQNISDGPCLSNELMPNLACDVAHNPRLLVDNLPENQCNAFINGTAKHFVEVDENCELIRAI